MGPPPGLIPEVLGAVNGWYRFTLSGPGIVPVKLSSAARRGRSSQRQRGLGAKRRGKGRGAHARMSLELPEMPLFFHPVALATNSKTLFNVEFVSPRPSEPRPQFASTVDKHE